MLASGITSDPSVAFPFGNVNVGNWQVFAQQPDVELDTSIESQVLAFFVNYGITDRFDVGLVVPLLKIELEGEMRATGLVDDFTAQNPILYGGSVTSDSESASGVGDVIVRAKYLMFEWETLKVAARADVSVPTGDEDDLLGTGEWGGLLQVIASTEWGRFSPHMNLGVRLQTGDSELNGLRYLIGCDARLTERFSMSVDYLGTDDFDNDGIGDRTHALSTGLKVNPLGRLVVSANVVWRLDDRGLRADWIPSVSVEYTFD
jgi:hypothetical protein